MGSLHPKHQISIYDLDAEITKSVEDIDDPAEKVHFLKTMLIIATMESKRLIQGLEAIVETSDPSTDVLGKVVTLAAEPSLYDMAEKILNEAEAEDDDDA